MTGGLFFASSMMVMTGLTYGRAARRLIRQAEERGDDRVAYRTRCYFWAMVGLGVLGAAGLFVALRSTLS